MLIIAGILKRPFSRPLAVWTGGILLQSLIDCRKLSLFLLLPPLLFLLFSYRKKKCPATVGYSSRYLWGITFSILLFVSSVQWTAYRQHYSSPVPAASGLRMAADEYREHLLMQWDRLDLDDREKSVLSTLTLGYRESMDRETRRKFSTIGVAHILAVSGFHVGIVGGFISFLLSGIPRRRAGAVVRYGLTVLLLWSYVFLTGLSPSSVRAGLMLSFFSDRPSPV